jgi:hypothetical protein
MLRRIYNRPYTLQSNFAREHAGTIGEAASRGLITTLVPSKEDGTLIPTREWRLTASGINHMNTGNKYGWTPLGSR